MQSSAKYCTVSVLCACCLLAGPSVLYEYSWNLVNASTPLVKQLLWRGELDRRNLRCYQSSSFYVQDASPQANINVVSASGSIAPLASVSAVPESSVNTPAAGATDATCRDATSAEPLRTSSESREAGRAQGSDEFLLEQYKAASSEIGDRLSQETLLFTLKFSVVGAIIAALFGLFREKAGASDDLESLILKRKTDKFFVAALLCSVIVDTRIRANAAAVDALGDWIWCVESRMNKNAGVGWEHFRWLELANGSYPILLFFSYALTALVLAATLYFYVIIPRTVNRATMTMLMHVCSIFFSALFLVAASYGPVRLPSSERWATLGDVPTILWSMLVAFLGMQAIVRALRSQYDRGSAFVCTRGLESVLHERVRFSVVHHVTALADEILDIIRTGRQCELNCLLKELNECCPGIAQQQDGIWSLIDPPTSQRQRVVERLFAISSFLHSTRIDKARAGRRLARRIAQLTQNSLSPSDRFAHEADLSEERLWAVYFQRTRSSETEVVDH